LGFSQDFVATNSNLTKSNISEIENGNINLAFTTFLELAKGLGIDPKKLLDYRIDLTKNNKFNLNITEKRCLGIFFITYVENRKEFIKGIVCLLLHINYRNELSLI
jgi:transcriptional regulator with XRE-family HTH domain